MLAVSSATGEANDLTNEEREHVKNGESHGSLVDDVIPLRNIGFPKDRAKRRIWCSAQPHRPKGTALLSHPRRTIRSPEQKWSRHPTPTTSGTSSLSFSLERQGFCRSTAAALNGQSERPAFMRTKPPAALPRALGVALGVQGTDAQNCLLASS